MRAGVTWPELVQAVRDGAGCNCPTCALVSLADATELCPRCGGMGGVPFGPPGSYQPCFFCEGKGRVLFPDSRR